MADNTINYNFLLPTVGGDSNIWGGAGGLNNNWIDIDVILKTQENVSTQTDADLAAAVISLQGQIDALAVAVVPAVGEILITADPANPVARYPGTTWVALAGVVLVGVGTSPSADAKVWALDDQEGNESHVVTEAEMPDHNHGAGSYRTGQAISNNTQTGGNSDRLNGNGGVVNTDILGVSAGTGGDGAHNNLQPTLAKHIWERTA